MNCSKFLTIVGLVFGVVASGILIFPNLNVKKNIKNDYITSIDRDGKYTQRKHLKERNINLWGLILLAIGFVLQLLPFLFSK